jgi:hypothetical protein
MLNFLVLSLLFASPVTGPQTVERGKSAVIKVPISAAGTAYSWKVEPEATQSVSGENKSETFLILLDVEEPVFVSFVSFEKQTHETHYISISGPSPPGPGPVPPPPPVPPTPPQPLPDGKYGLANAALTWVVTFVPAEHRSKAKPLADQFRAVASMIAAGALKDAQPILTEIRTRNNMVLGGSTEAWKPWGKQLSTMLERLDSEKKLIPPEDYRIAFEEVATGLEGVK